LELKPRPGFGRGQARLKKSAQDSGPWGTADFLRIPLPLEQPTVENQQISIAATPTIVILAAGYAMHPGFTPDSA